MNSQKTDALARTLWDYHHLDHPLRKSDCILVLGSHDLRVAERGVDLFLEGWAPLLAFSGGQGRLTRDWTQTEAERFAEVALRRGVPKQKILIENRSTNTGENVQFSKDLLARQGLHPQRVLLVHKPYMERRAYATFKKFWPEPEVIVTSPQVDFDEYVNEEFPRDRVINIMVGDLQRIMEYPGKGFQIPQPVPPDVLDAYQQLVSLGYTKHLIA